MQAIIYKLVRCPRLKSLLESESLQVLLQAQSDPLYCDTDPLFDEPRNCDFSHRHGGLLKERFVTLCEPFLRVCVEREGLDVSVGGVGLAVWLCDCVCVTVSRWIVVLIRSC